MALVPTWPIPRSVPNRYVFKNPLCRVFIWSCKVNNLIGRIRSSAEQIATAGAPRASGSNGCHGKRQTNRSFINLPASSGGRYLNFNESRYVQTILAFHDSFGGHIARFAVEWSKLTLDPWILSTVSQGLQLDFISEPVQFSIPPNACMEAYLYDCCKQEVNLLIEKGAIVRARDQGFISSIFLIPKRTGGYRPIINLKALNCFLFYKKFKMEGISSVRHTIRERDWLTKLDLKDAYLTVPIFEDHRKFL
jgi:hypothetical protein